MAVGLGIALVVSLLLSLLIGLFSLRVKAIFFAMITLAVASAFLAFASQLSGVTGGEDGLTFKVPEALQPGTQYLEEPLLGASIDGRFASYYLLFAVAVVLVLVMLRIVNSPFGRVLQAIRENDFRAEAIGYRTVVYRTIASVLSALLRATSTPFDCPITIVYLPMEIMTPIARKARIFRFLDIVVLSDDCIRILVTETQSSYEYVIGCGFLGRKALTTSLRKARGSVRGNFD